jgi:hypothetical protein
MAESGVFRPGGLQSWQRSNIVAAATYLRDQLARSPDDERLRVVLEGLLDVLDPSRLVVRRQREMAEAAKQAAASLKQDRRRTGERRRAERRAADRRQASLGPPSGIERRTGVDRRAGRDRRTGRDRRS